MDRRLAGLSLLLAALASPSQLAAADLWGRKPPQDSGPLHAEEAFRLLPVEQHDGTLRVEWDIVPGYYLYRHRIRISALRDDGEHALQARMPQGHAHHDEHFGDVQIYRGDTVVTVPGASGVRRVRVRFQGCADIGICYPPQQLDVDVAG